MPLGQHHTPGAGSRRWEQSILDVEFWLCSNDPMSGALEAAEWRPDLPAGCPLAGAESYRGSVYRFSDPGDSDEWKLPCEKYGRDWYEALKPVSQCRAHAFSVFKSQDAIEAFRRLIPKFRESDLVRFSLDTKSGVLLEGERRDGHHSLWPSGDFEFPPETENVT